MRPKNKKPGGARLNAAGRPRGPARIGIYVRVLPGTLRRIDRECFDRVKSRGSLIDEWHETVPRQEPLQS